MAAAQETAGGERRARGVWQVSVSGELSFSLQSHLCRALLVSVSRLRAAVHPALLLVPSAWGPSAACPPLPL